MVIWKRVDEELPIKGKTVMVAGVAGTTPLTGLAYLTGPEGKPVWQIQRGSLRSQLIQRWADTPDPPTDMVPQQMWNRGQERPAHIVRKPSRYLILRLREWEKKQSQSAHAKSVADSIKPQDGAN